MFHEQTNSDEETIGLVGVSVCARNGLRKVLWFYHLTLTSLFNLIKTEKKLIQTTIEHFPFNYFQLFLLSPQQDENDPSR